jgi:hypothetical protein
MLLYEDQNSFLGKGEVVSSILTGSTIKPSEITGFSPNPLSCPPLFDPEQGENMPLGLGENWGKIFSGCSRSSPKNENAGQGVGDLSGVKRITEATSKLRPRECLTGECLTSLGRQPCRAPKSG